VTNAGDQIRIDEVNDSRIKGKILARKSRLSGTVRAGYYSTHVIKHGARKRLI